MITGEATERKEIGVTGIGDVVTDALEQKHRHEIDGAAFSAIIERFQDMAYGYAYALVRDPILAQDVVQESFLLAWHRLEQLDCPSAFPAWFRSIVRRVAMSELQRRRPSSISLEIEAQIASPVDSPADDLLRSESITEIRRAIDQLPERLRTSVILHYVEGYRIDDIAAFLGIGVAAAKKRLQRGREHMKKRLEERIRRTIDEMRPSKDTRLMEQVNIYTNFTIAAQLGQISLLEAMLVDGVDVNEPDSMGRTLLHWAVENNHIEAIDLLLKNGADQNLRDRDGRSPRHIAQASPNGPTIVRMMNAYR